MRNKVLVRTKSRLRWSAVYDVQHVKRTGDKSKRVYFPNVENFNNTFLSILVEDAVGTSIFNSVTVSLEEEWSEW